jgi:hypothetical protein
MLRMSVEDLIKSHQLYIINIVNVDQVEI